MLGRVHRKLLREVEWTLKLDAENRRAEGCVKRGKVGEEIRKWKRRVDEERKRQGKEQRVESLECYSKKLEVIQVDLESKKYILVELG